MKVKIILILTLILIFISKSDLPAKNNSDAEWTKRSLSSSRAEFYLEYCIMYSESNNFMEGLKQCKAAITHKPDYAKAYYEMCIIYLAMEKYEEANSSCKQAVNINPEYKDALIMLDEIFKAKSKGKVSN